MAEPWERQEKRVAKRIGGRRQPGSGNGWRHKNDVAHVDCLLEMKHTDKKQITIKQADLDALRYHAVLIGKVPVLHIEIGDRRYVMVEEDDFFG